MKTWKIKYTYFKIGQVDSHFMGECVMRGATYENVRVDLRAQLAKDGYNLYRFIAAVSWDGDRVSHMEIDNVV